MDILAFASTLNNASLFLITVDISLIQKIQLFKVQREEALVFSRVDKAIVQ